MELVSGQCERAALPVPRRDALVTWGADEDAGYRGVDSKRRFAVA